MIYPGQHQHPAQQKRRIKPDRWLVGLAAGAVLLYLGGKLMGLGKGKGSGK